MVAATDTIQDLTRFSVEWVEGVWLGSHDEPRALAVKRMDGRRGLLAAKDITAVVPDQERVVVSPPPLLELDAPRLEAGDAGVDSRVVASWATTGAALPPPAERGAGTDRVVWKVVAFLYAAIFLVVTTVITLAFVIAYLVTGQAY